MSSISHVTSRLIDKLRLPKYFCDSSSHSSTFNQPVCALQPPMPPKPRGQGSTRARGGGRGGATVGRSSASASASDATDTATPQDTTTSEAPEAFQPSMIPKQESNNDTNPLSAGDHVSATIESQAPSSVATSYACSICRKASPMLLY